MAECTAYTNMDPKIQEEGKAMEENKEKLEREELKNVTGGSDDDELYPYYDDPDRCSRCGAPKSDYEVRDIGRKGKKSVYQWTCPACGYSYLGSRGK